MRSVAAFGIACLVGVAFVPDVALAQATRTWVSGVGDDVNPCSRTAPCKTFAGTISKTAAGGEINCLDSGGFGGVTITKSMAIVCEGVEAGVLVSAGPGITVNAGPNDVVFLRGLDIEGLGLTTTVSPGTIGIRFIAGAALHVQNTRIRGFKAAASGHGIHFTPGAGAATLTVVDSYISNNNSGINVNPTGAATAKVVLNKVQTVNNSTFGIAFDGRGGTGAVDGSVWESQTSSNGSNGVLSITAVSGGATVQVMVDHSATSNNGTNGLQSNGGTSTIRVSNTVITGNATGVTSVNSGALLTYKNNSVDGNGAPGAFTGTLVPE
ncbi:MAG: hypothetical protein QOI12_5255 [Alphaproteobacteria bacterium]|jgi:hypothetical protein|nr:hypothetical protein [Alphaproteobacteria bacterium]